MQILTLDAIDLESGWAMYKVLATMVHPENDRAREELLAIFWARNLARVKEVYKDTFKEAFKDTVKEPYKEAVKNIFKVVDEMATKVFFSLPIGDPSVVIQVLRQAPSEDKVFAHIQRAFYGGYLAGRILQLMGRMQMAGAVPSVGKAVFLLNDILGEWQTQTGQNLPRSRKEMYKAWGDFKSVAHFWAAHYIKFPQDHVDSLCTTCAHMARPVASHQRLTTLLSPTPCVFLVFLALSEWFLHWGSTHSPHHQRNPSPWLDPGTTWRCEMPALPKYRLPCINMTGPPLTDEHRAVLLRYKANDRFREELHAR